jgi:hypothetical protein
MTLNSVNRNFGTKALRRDGVMRDGLRDTQGRGAFYKRHPDRCSIAGKGTGMREGLRSWLSETM